MKIRKFESEGHSTSPSKRIRELKVTESDGEHPPLRRLVLANVCGQLARLPELSIQTPDGPWVDIMGWAILLINTINNP